MEVGDDNKATKLPDYTALSSQLASATPSGVQASRYKPSNSPRSCPNIDNTWKASVQLPPSPNQRLCDCMFANLTCVAKAGISSEDIQTNFDFICNPKLGNYCGGVDTDAEKGVYGAYSMCNATQRLSFAFNAYYEDQTASNPENNNPCNFKGVGVQQQSSSQSGCEALVSQAGPAGTGVVTSAPTPTPVSGGGGGAPASSSSTGAASPLSIPTFDFGLLRLAGYVSAAAMVGAGMVML